MFNLILQSAEKIYQISLKNILHIHGTVNYMIYGNSDSAINDIGPEKFSIDFENYEKDEIDTDSYATSGIEDFMNTIQYSDSEQEELKKKLSEQLNDENRSFEKELQMNKLEKFMNILPKNIHKIIVLGHSLSKIDAPYLEFIRDMLPKIHWYVSYYGCSKNMSNYKNLSFSNDISLFEFPK